MTKLTKQNAGGVDYTMVGCVMTGACNSAAASYLKELTISDGDIFADGMGVVCLFNAGNVAGTAPNGLTLYSSDQVNYYTDSELTEPYTLAPAGCYQLEYTGTGNAYNYLSYPAISFNGEVLPLCTADGKYASGALWNAGDKLILVRSSGKVLIVLGGSPNGGVGIAFVGTHAEYNTAKLIPEGEDGFIPSGSKVIITDEDAYVTGDER